MRAGAPVLRGLLAALVAVGLSACQSAGQDTQAAFSSAQVSEPPGAAAALSDPAPAVPDPAPAAPDPALPAPDLAPAAPDPAPVSPAAGSGAALPLPGSRAEEPPTPVEAACADVLEALTDAVIRYETAALAEASGSGSRSKAAADMLVLIERARAAAGSQPGVPSASAPAIDAVIALRGGFDTRETLDEDDAAPWRGPRKELQGWCSRQS